MKPQPLPELRFFYACNVMTGCGGEPAGSLLFFILCSKDNPYTTQPIALQLSLNAMVFNPLQSMKIMPYSPQTLRFMQANLTANHATLTSIKIATAFAFGATL